MGNGHPDFWESIARGICLLRADETPSGCILHFRKHHHHISQSTGLLHCTGPLIAASVTNFVSPMSIKRVPFMSA